MDALTGALLALAEPGLRSEAALFTVLFVRHLTLVGLAQQAGPAANALHEQEVRKLNDDF